MRNLFVNSKIQIGNVSTIPKLDSSGKNLLLMPISYEYAYFSVFEICRNK